MWNGWPLERLLYLFLGAAFLLVWIQVSLYHYRAAFHNRLMWGPVLFTPLLVLSALGLGLWRTPLTSLLFLILFGCGVLEGLAGIALHLRGVSRLVGGLNLRNWMLGPPVVLAVVYAALSLLGVLIDCWPRLTGSSAGGS
jgi:hypothetical protein